MPTELSLTEPLTTSLRSLARERLTDAISCLTTTLSDESVHSARKRLKELRALLRLMREPLSRTARRRENTALRDAARPLSRLRDAAVLLETLDDLTEGQQDPSPQSLAPLRGALADVHREAITSTKTRSLRTRLAQWLSRFPTYPLRCTRSALDFTPLLPGLRRTYRDGRRAMQSALDDPTDDRFHEWRKRAKDLRYELEFLTPLDAPTLRPLAKRAKRLTDLLGQDHDLAVLLAHLTTTYVDTLPNETHAALETLLLKRRRHLQRTATKLGRDLYSAKPKAFVRKLSKSWPAKRA